MLTAWCIISSRTLTCVLISADATEILRAHRRFGWVSRPAAKIIRSR
jgi:hypothetical protein